MGGAEDHGRGCPRDRALASQSVAQGPSAAAPPGTMAEMQGWMFVSPTNPYVEALTPQW